MKRPWYLVPPLSWIMPFSESRRVQLDPLGAALFEMCDGRRTVEEIIERFAVSNLLSFRESQLAVVSFLQLLTARGLVALAGAGGEEAA